MEGGPDGPLTELERSRVNSIEGDCRGNPELDACRMGSFFVMRRSHLARTPSTLICAEVRPRRAARSCHDRSRGCLPHVRDGLDHHNDLIRTRRYDLHPKGI